MLSKAEMTLKNFRKSCSQANSQQSRTGQSHVERSQNVMFRRVTL